MDLGDALDDTGDGGPVAALALSVMIWFVAGLGVLALVRGNPVIGAFLLVLATALIIVRRVSSFVDGAIDAVLGRIFRSDGTDVG